MVVVFHGIESRISSEHFLGNPHHDNCCCPHINWDIGVACSHDSSFGAAGYRDIDPRHGCFLLCASMGNSYGSSWWTMAFTVVLPSVTLCDCWNISGYRRDPGSCRFQTVIVSIDNLVYLEVFSFLSTNVLIEVALQTVHQLFGERTLNFTFAECSCYCPALPTCIFTIVCSIS